MIITYIDGIYRMDAESTNSSELIKELYQAINMLEQETEEYKTAYYTTPQCDYQGGH